MSEGELYIMGRKNDIIIRSGQNYYAHDFESALDDIEGIRQGCIACFGIPAEETGTDKIIVWADIKREYLIKQERVVPLHKKVKKRLFDRFGIYPDQVDFFPPGSIPKTPSGKIQRLRCQELYKEGYRPTEKN